jgi:hypothetical protein
MKDNGKEDATAWLPEFGMSSDLLALVVMAADHGIRSTTGHEPMHPFVMIKDGEDIQMLRIIDDPATAIPQARQHVASVHPSQWAIAFDGYVTMEGRRTDAIVVEAGEAASEYVVRFAQRYSPATGSALVEERGNLAFLGRFDNHEHP